MEEQEKDLAAFADATSSDEVDENAEERRVYELGYHIVPVVGEGNLQGEVTILREAIQSRGGAIFAEGEPEMIRLAYDMKKAIESERHTFDSAYFGWMRFDMEPGSVVELAETVRTMPNILRHILLETPRDISPRRRPETDTEGGEKTEAGEEAAPKAAVDEAEIDKTIEELVVE